MNLTRGACYAFLGILGAICIMNMINTMIHSVHVRKKEIGMLQAVGMSDFQLQIMLQLEGVFYNSRNIVDRGRRWKCGRISRFLMGKK